MTVCYVKSFFHFYFCYWFILLLVYVCIVFLCYRSSYWKKFLFICPLIWKTVAKNFCKQRFATNTCFIIFCYARVEENSPKSRLTLSSIETLNVKEYIEFQLPRFCSLAFLIPMQTQWRSQPKLLAGAKILTSGEKRYFVWDTTSQSTKWLDMLKILGRPWPPGYACVQTSSSSTIWRAASACFSFFASWRFRTKVKHYRVWSYSVSELRAKFRWNEQSIVFVKFVPW